MPHDFSSGGTETPRALGSELIFGVNAKILQMLAVPTVMEAARIDILEKLVFARIQVMRDIRKEYISYQNILRGNAAHKICTIIWNYSEAQNEIPTLNGRRPTVEVLRSMV